jgi:hypothetical protein
MGGRARAPARCPKSIESRLAMRSPEIRRRASFVTDPAASLRLPVRSTSSAPPSCPVQASSSSARRADRPPRKRGGPERRMTRLPKQTRASPPRGRALVSATKRAGVATLTGPCVGGRVGDHAAGAAEQKAMTRRGVAGGAHGSVARGHGAEPPCSARLDARGNRAERWDRRGGRTEGTLTRADLEARTEHPCSVKIPSRGHRPPSDTNEHSAHAAVAPD